MECVGKLLPKKARDHKYLLTEYAGEKDEPSDS